MEFITRILEEVDDMVGITRTELISNEKKRRLIGDQLLISIGINNYKNKDDCLENCEFDANTVYSVFEKSPCLSIHPASKLILSDDGTPTAKKVILKTISTTLEHVKEKTNIIFFYSGHGCIINEQFFFVLSDSDGSSDSMISLDELIGYLNNSNGGKHGNITVLIDACRVIAHHTKSLENKSDKYIFDYLKKTNGMGIMYACAVGEYSLDFFNEQAISVFTSFLIDALNGYSDALDGGYLTFNSMFKYIEEASYNASRSFTQINQHPMCWFSGNDIVYGFFDEKTYDFPLVQHSFFSFRDRVLDTMEDLECALSRLAAEYGIIPFFEEKETGTYSLTYALQACKKLFSEYAYDMDEVVRGWEGLLCNLYYFKDMVNENKYIHLPIADKLKFLEDIGKVIGIMFIFTEPD